MYCLIKSYLLNDMLRYSDLCFFKKSLLLAQSQQIFMYFSCSKVNLGSIFVLLLFTYGLIIRLLFNFTVFIREYFCFQSFLNFWTKHWFLVGITVSKPTMTSHTNDGLIMELLTHDGAVYPASCWLISHIDDRNLW